jgi:glycosidase
VTKRLRLYEINTRAFCGRFDEISSEWLSKLASLGFNAIWLMGAWRIGPGSKAMSQVLSRDFDGSPFAISGYEFSPELGGRTAYLDLLRRARGAGLRVLLDFIPNHMGLDCPWISEDPSQFIRSDPALRKQDPGDYFLHPSSEVVAHGRDPYFPPWFDTAQLDYSSANLRRNQIANLKRISQDSDGVRCDMAMLVLRDYFRERWYPNAPEGWLNERMPGEFWAEAIAEIKSNYPEFIFLAEAYWGKEPDLQRLGFDLTYEKSLYDALVARNAGWIKQLLSRPADLLRRSLFFIENHDEARAASVFEPDENLAAMALLLALPGSVLVHQGQPEGFRRSLPIQIAGKTSTEQPERQLQEAYEALLTCTSDPLFDNGEFRILSSPDPGVVAFLRSSVEKTVIYAGQIGGDASEFQRSEIDITEVARAVGADDAVILKSLLGSGSTAIHRIADKFTVMPGELAEGKSRFVLFQVIRPEHASAELQAGLK